MTVIAAVAREGRVWMAADTASHAGTTRYAAPPKIRHHPNGVLVAAAGQTAILAALRDPELIPDCDTDDLDEWAQCTAERITAALLAVEPPLVDDGSINGEILLARAGRLWYIDANLATPARDGVAVLGSGSDIAYGAVQALLSLNQPSLHVVTTAVAIACQRNAGCALVDGTPQVEVA